VVVVPEDGSPLQIFGKEGNSSHDTLLSKFVPVEQHNRTVKIEYTFPHCITLDAPDEDCRKQAIDLGVAEIVFGVARLKESIASEIMMWLVAHPLKHDLKTLHRANLSGAKQSGADLSGADLSGADLSGADLSGADLRWADLRWADLRWADLRWADLSEANLRRADLRWADLSEANLRRADLRWADLSWADLSRADLSDEQKEYCKSRGAILGMA
jgi:uncharacterized protein YjbI with pentapeptide repeats